MQGRRIVIVGQAGSGKTTLAKQIAQVYGIRHIELDNLSWGANWEPEPDDVFLTRVAEALTTPNWVVDGNYSRTRPLVWEKAETVIWLDYSLWGVIMPRLFWRTVKRYVGREQLWDAKNKERFWIHFYDKKESLFWWAISTYKEKKMRYESALTDSAYQHIHFIRLRHPNETKEWVAEHLG